MKLKLQVVRSELEPGLVVRSESELEIETTFPGNLWLPVPVTVTTQAEGS